MSEDQRNRIEEAKRRMLDSVDTNMRCAFELTREAKRISRMEDTKKVVPILKLA